MGYKTAAEEAAEAAAALSDAEMRMVIAQVQRESVVRFGSISNALRTLKVNQRLEVHKEEVKQLFKEFGFDRSIAPRFFRRNDIHGDEWVSIKLLRTVFDPLSVNYADSYDGSDVMLANSKPSKCQEKLEHIRMKEVERFQVITAQLKKIGIAASARYSNIHKAFMALDRDRSGWINRKEVRDFYRIYGFGTRDADYFFEFMDANGDGVLSFKDFTSIMGDYIDVPPACGKKKEGVSDHESTLRKGLPDDPELCRVIQNIGFNAAAKHSSLRTAFTSLDLDSSGTLTKPEVRIFFRNFGYPSKQLADKFFEYLDSDGGGVISYQEFKNFFAPFICPASAPLEEGEDPTEGVSTYTAMFSTPNLKLAYEGGEDDYAAVAHRLPVHHHEDDYQVVYDHQGVLYDHQLLP